MSAGDAPRAARLRRHRLYASLLAGVGLCMVLAMALTEGEPGALPLLVTVSGLAWLGATLLRMRRR